MDERELVRLFSDFWKIGASAVKDDLRLDNETLKNQSSVRFYQFIAAVESNFNVKVRDINKIFTFRDLVDRIVPE